MLGTTVESSGVEALIHVHQINRLSHKSKDTFFFDYSIARFVNHINEIELTSAFCH